MSAATYTLADHLLDFDPPFVDPQRVHDVAAWAIDQAKLGQWLSTTVWCGDVVSVTHVVEHLRLGVFIPSPDAAWAPLD